MIYYLFLGVYYYSFWIIYASEIKYEIPSTECIGNRSTVHLLEEGIITNIVSGDCYNELLNVFNIAKGCRNLTEMCVFYLKANYQNTPNNAKELNKQYQNKIKITSYHHDFRKCNASLKLYFKKVLPHDIDNHEPDLKFHCKGSSFGIFDNIYKDIYSDMITLVMTQYENSFFELNMDFKYVQEVVDGYYCDGDTFYVESSHCDGIKNCEDGQDEMHCENEDNEEPSQWHKFVISIICCICFICIMVFIVKRRRRNAHRRHIITTEERLNLPTSSDNTIPVVNSAHPSAPPIESNLPPSNPPPYDLPPSYEEATLEALVKT